MILVDDRIGSADLAAPLTQMGLPVELLRMDSADVAFEGKGTAGRSVNVGIELKKVPDLVQSIRTGRLAGEQLPKMLGPQGAYDYGWLLIEGQWRTDPKTGQLLTRSTRRFGSEWKPLPGRMTGAELEKQVLTLQLCGGLLVRHCSDRTTTLQFIANLYRWWTDKPMDEHRSHIAVHTATSFLPVSDFRAVVSRFPHIGLRTSIGVENLFGGNLVKAVNASAAEWAEVETIDRKGKGRRLGLKAGRDIAAFCRGV